MPRLSLNTGERGGGVRDGERQLIHVQAPHTMGAMARPKKVVEAGLALLSI